jgi:hypothetical protein
MRRRCGGHRVKISPHPAGDQGDEAPPPGPPTLKLYSEGWSPEVRYEPTEDSHKTGPQDST